MPTPDVPSEPEDQNHLLSDIRLAAPDWDVGGEEDASRLMVSFGPAEAARIPITGEQLWDRALLASAPWRPAKQAEWARIAAEPGKNENWSRTVGIGAIDPALLAEFHHLFAGCDDPREAERRCHRPQQADLEHRLVDHLIDAFATATNRTRLIGRAIGTPGKHSTSLDRNSGLYQGIHIDSFDDLPQLERHLARNRISVNLGYGDRWLVFAATSYGSIARIVGPRDAWPRPVIMEFFARHPDQPIFRARLRPGEAYIAPTENIVHDGYTVGNPHLDISFNVLGDFCGG